MVNKIGRASLVIEVHEERIFLTQLKRPEVLTDGNTAQLRRLPTLVPKYLPNLPKHLGSFGSSGPRNFGFHSRTPAGC